MQNTLIKEGLSEAELNGLINLLKDSEERILNLLSEQIKTFDSQAMKQVDDLTKESNDKGLQENWSYVRRLSLSHALKEWKIRPNLENGLFIIAKLEYPSVDVEKYKKILDNYAQRVKERMNVDSSEYDITDAINEVLFEEENFSGNQIFYYDVANNFINSAIDSKTGNPITLSAIYILVARRLGVEIEGIGTPGHFIIKYGDRFLDPFFKGREITKDECHIRAQELGVFWRDDYLDPISDEAIVSRTIRNLIAIYKRNKNYDKAADASDLLSAI